MLLDPRPSSFTGLFPWVAPCAGPRRAKSPSLTTPASLAYLLTAAEDADLALVSRRQP